MLTLFRQRVIRLNAMFSWKKFRLPSRDVGSVMKAAQLGPATCCRKLKAFVCMKKGSDNDTDSSEIPSSGEDDTVQKWVLSFPPIASAKTPVRLFCFVSPAKSRAGITSTWLMMGKPAPCTYVELYIHMKWTLRCLCARNLYRANVSNVVRLET